MASTATDRTAGLASKTAIKGAVKAATTANITLAAAQTIDGISCVENDRVLVKDQTDATKNGIYCVDVETEALTKRGFVGLDDLRTSDEVLTINPANGMAEWNAVDEVCRFPVSNYEMVAVNNPLHSSLTTPNHRWPLLCSDDQIMIWESRHIHSGLGPMAVAADRADRIIRDGTTGKIIGWQPAPNQNFEDMRLPVAANYKAPDRSEYSDEFVALVAWFITEGHIRKLSNGKQGRNIRICQSQSANPEKTQRIRGILTALYGNPVASLLGNLHRKCWREHLHVDGKLVVFSLNATASGDLLSVAPDKIVADDFILALTNRQLSIFLNTAIDGDGHRRDDNPTYATYFQKSARALHPVHLAAILSGKATRITQVPGGTYGNGVNVLSIKDRQTIGLPSIKKSSSRTAYTGEVWCPRVKNGTWFARRAGTCFFTGNTVSSGFWTRTRDFSRNDDLKQGALVWVNQGASQGTTLWTLTTANDIVIDTSNIAFSKTLELDGSYQVSHANLDSISALTSAEVTTLEGLAALTTTAAALTVLEIADPGVDRIIAWDDTAGAMAAIALADILTEASPASGDFLLMYGAEGDLRKVNWSSLTSVEIVNDTSPTLGGALDAAGFDINLNGGAIESPDGTDQLTIVNGEIQFLTASTERFSIDDSGMQLGGANARVTTILDEDAMGSDSATALATQQSIKAYVDAAISNNVIGIDQTPTNVTGSRSGGTVYQNTTGKPIMVIVQADNVNRDFRVSENSTLSGSEKISDFNYAASICFIIPDDWYYGVDASTTIYEWWELR